MAMRCAMVIGLACLLCGTRADAQRNCRKGIPCGNTCISATKTCRIGSGTRPAAKPNPSSTPKAQTLVAPADSAQWPWVADTIQRIYLASACIGTASLPASARMLFRREQEIQRLGFVRAKPDVERCTLAQIAEHERRLAAVVPH